MEQRPLRLVTSWWVVGVWAALGIGTGVISVVAVLQPSWYVRYTLIHAHEAPGRAFKVVVSSVGPLGYCRLTSVGNPTTATAIKEGGGAEPEAIIEEERNGTRSEQDGVSETTTTTTTTTTTKTTTTEEEEKRKSEKSPRGKGREGKERERKGKGGKRPKSDDPNDGGRVDVEASTDIRRLLEFLQQSTKGSGLGQVSASTLKGSEEGGRPQNDPDDIAAPTYVPRTPILLCSGLGVGRGSSAVWALVGGLYGAAGVVQAVAGVASLALNFTRAHARRYALAVWVGNAQVAVVMSQSVALVLFPLGLGSPLARVECGGSSTVYWPGECTFGWSYMLGVVATSLALYCPCLARLTVFRRYVLREWEGLSLF